MTRFAAHVGWLLVGVTLIAVASFGVRPASGANILGVFLSPSPSHLIVHMALIKALAEKGHNITVVSTIQPKGNYENMNIILIPPSKEHQANTDAKMSQLAQHKSNLLQTLGMVLISSQSMIDMQFDTLQDKRFTSLYENQDNKFDVVILGYFINDFQLVVGAKFKCPIIISWPTQPMEIVDGLVGNPQEISYVPIMQTQGKVMGFLQRVQNMITGKLMQAFTIAMNYKMKGYYNKVAEIDPTLPAFDVMQKNVSLIFCNSHFSEGPIRPLTPATVLIGGIQIKEKPDALPKNIADFLAASNVNGSILFSLGSNVKSKYIEPEIVQVIYKVLSSLKQNVIWKWEDLQNTPGNASNILYQKWLPQDDILAHPNVKLFITHAGKGGMAEALYHGVPMVAIPVFGDQPANAERIEFSGYGLQVNLLQLTETTLKNAIEEVLNNPAYVNNIKAFARLYRDRPMSARESVVYWTEYVIRHRGAAHMQSPVVHMNFVQSANLDIKLVIYGTLFLLFKLTKLIVRTIWRKLSGIKAIKKAPKPKKD